MMLEIFNTKIAVLASAISAISLFFTATGIITFSSPIATFEDGAVQGRIAYSRNGNEYFEYLGIPFAQPPVGMLRFQPPEPVIPWREIKSVKSYPPFCAQFDLFLGRVSGVEDCLYLNVFTHSIEPNARKPVMIFIHGGAFLAGSSSLHGPKYFMDENIVLVSINYRLGPLGFLNTGDELVRGNMGLKDQNLALRWVQRNVHKFGGDPSRVTIFGESAGAASVSYHVISKASRGLFHKAIQQSTPIFHPMTFTRTPKEVVIKYAKYLNCPTENSVVMVDCLNETDVATLVTPQSLISDPTNEDIDVFMPSLETVIRPDTFLSEDPMHLLKSGDFTKVPLIIGVNSGEGALFASRFEAIPELITKLDENWTSVLPRVLGYKELEYASHKIREFYFPSDKPLADNINEFRKNFTMLASDALFYRPTYQTAVIHAKHGAPTYIYYYDYDSVLLPSFYSFFRAPSLNDWLPAEIKIAFAVTFDWIAKHIFGGEQLRHDIGACHADELFQLFNLMWIIERFSPNDLPFSQKLVKLFADFAWNEPLEFNNVSWPPIHVDPDEYPKLEYMLLNNEGKIIPEPFTDRIRFWESLNIGD